MKLFTLPDGRRLAWRESGAGRPVVLVHGWAMSCAVFDEIRERLAGDFRVLTPDLPGHGASQACADYSLTSLAGDLAAWLDSLALKELNLIGWSLGGQVLMQLAAGKSSVRRLGLVSTTPCFTRRDGWEAGLPAGQVRSMTRNLKRSYEKTMGDFFARQFAGEQIPRERYREIVRFAVRGGRLPAFEDALAALETLAETDQRPLLGRIEVPALVMHGGKDTITPPAAGAYLADHLPMARLVPYPDLGHAPFLSRPAEVLEKWREFLQ